MIEQAELFLEWLILQFVLFIERMLGPYEIGFAQ